MLAVWGAKESDRTEGLNWAGSPRDPSPTTRLRPGVGGLLSPSRTALSSVEAPDHLSCCLWAGFPDDQMSGLPPPAPSFHGQGMARPQAGSPSVLAEHTFCRCSLTLGLEVTVPCAVGGPPSGASCLPRSCLCSGH